MHGRRSILAALTAAALVAALPAAAQDWPTKPIRIITGFVAGGPTDILARVLGEYMTRQWGQPVVVEARTGAGGNVAADLTARAAPDGYTFHVTSITVSTIFPWLYEKLSYDVNKDLMPIAVLTRTPLVLQTSMPFPVKSYQEFVALMRKETGKHNFGSPGVGSMVHLAAELFKARHGFDSTHIAYRGAAPFGEALVKNEVQWGTDSIGNAVIHKDRIRVLAVADSKRAPEFPDVPTLAELGVANFEVHTTFILYGPAGLPAAIAQKMEAAALAGMREPFALDRLKTIGVNPSPLSTADTLRYIESERAKWVPLIKANNIKAE
ncbi:MAG: tripartite tricarboxylate transporter substrate binding protein [Alphaproteobacteria bacterium]|nr:tripartite tricarboxylate transporter substrate binding protein [Alphaproteobacteria bacterium]